MRASRAVNCKLMAAESARLSGRAVKSVNPETSGIDFRNIPIVDETYRRQMLVLAQVSNDDAEAFRGSYHYLQADLVAEQEFVSS